jgi:hypothetical protein
MAKNMAGKAQVEDRLDSLKGVDNFEGVSDVKYINAKGTPFGDNAFFNYLPPGQDIDNQHDADIREASLKSLVNPAGYHPFGSK